MKQLLKAAEYAKLAYSKKNINSFKFNDVEGIISKEDNTIYIGIRGTDELIDWTYNLLFFKQYIGLKYRAYETFFGLYSYLKSIKEDQIVLTGHSSGAAVAAFCSILLYQFFNYNVDLYGFGSPRLGGKDIYKQLKESCQSITFLKNNKDLITYLPFRYQPNPYDIRIETDINWINIYKNHKLNTYTALAKDLALLYA